MARLVYVHLHEFQHTSYTTVKLYMSIIINRIDESENEFNRVHRRARKFVYLTISTFVNPLISEIWSQNRLANTVYTPGSRPRRENSTLTIPPGRTSLLKNRNNMGKDFNFTDT